MTFRSDNLFRWWMLALMTHRFCYLILWWLIDLMIFCFNDFSQEVLALIVGWWSEDVFAQLVEGSGVKEIYCHHKGGRIFGKIIWWNNEKESVRIQKAFAFHVGIWTDFEWGILSMFHSAFVRAQGAGFACIVCPRCKRISFLQAVSFIRDVGVSLVREQK